MQYVKPHPIIPSITPSLIQATSPLPSAPRGMLMRPSYMIGGVSISEPRMIVPPPRGDYDISKPLDKKGYFTSRGIRQHNNHAFSGGNLPVPEGGKAKYDPTKRVLNEQSEERENEFLGVI